MADSDTRVRVVLPDGSKAYCSLRQAEARGYKLYDENEQAQSDSDDENTAPEGDDTPDTGSVAQDATEGQEETSSDEVVQETPAPKPDAADVRKWCAENDVPVNAQGKIPNAVYEQYAAAH